MKKKGFTITLKPVKERGILPLLLKLFLTRRKQLKREHAADKELEYN